MKMFKIALLSAVACFGLYASASGLPSKETEAEKLAKYADIDEQVRISEMTALLMGQHGRVGSGSTVQQLSPPAMRQIAEALTELYPHPQGRRLYLYVIDETKTIPYEKISIKLMSDNDTFDDLSRRLRDVFKIPANTQIDYIYSEIPAGQSLVSHVSIIEPDIPGSGNQKISEWLPAEPIGSLLVTIRPK